MTLEYIKQNPLTIITAVHAYAINDLDVDEDIKELITSNAELIRTADKQEVYNTFCEIMTTKNPARYIQEFKEVFFEIIPGLKETYGFEQNNSWHIYDVFEHTMHVIENTSDNLNLRIAALFHDLGKPRTYTEEKRIDENGNETIVGHFYNHPRISKNYFDLFASIYGIDKKSKESIEKLILYHDYKLSRREAKIRSYIEDLGVENVPLMFELKRADNLSQNLKKSTAVLKVLDEMEVLFNKVIAENYPDYKPSKKELVL